MPNWCNNTITIRGDANKLKSIWDEAQKQQGLLAAMVPQPEDMFHGNLGEAERAECVEKGIPNWYDWNVSNWGTKWDVGLEGLEYTVLADGSAEISGWFDSAWSPPIEALNTFSEANEDLSVECFYLETGMCFVGCWDSDGGDDYYEYADCNSKDIRDVVPDYLVSEFDLENMLAEWEEDEEELGDLSPNMS
ncbi:MAG: hypothetical protein VW715_15760 [Rhodospirillales bacterium]|jgi:hypothetical protein